MLFSTTNDDCCSHYGTSVRSVDTHENDYDIIGRKT